MKPTLEKHLTQRIEQLRKYRLSPICSEIHKERLTAKIEAYEDIIYFIGEEE